MSGPLVEARDLRKVFAASTRLAPSKRTSSAFAPLHTAVYTHGHVDHAFGLRAFLSHCAGVSPFSTGWGVMNQAAIMYGDSTTGSRIARMSPRRMRGSW
jgi:glyoxylase-like metal-dependent hydrolase (beta-lactamase superfamily II)